MIEAKQWEVVSQKEEPNGDLVSFFKLTQKMGGQNSRTYHLRIINKKGMDLYRVQIYMILRVMNDDCINESKMVFFTGKLESEEELQVVTNIILRS